MVGENMDQTNLLKEDTEGTDLSTIILKDLEIVIRDQGITRVGISPTISSTNILQRTKKDLKTETEIIEETTILIKWLYQS